MEILKDRKNKTSCCLEPLDDEIVWGVPADEISEVKKQDGFCPIKKINCNCWDEECLAVECLNN